jgi:hypothetical protein
MQIYGTDVYMSFLIVMIVDRQKKREHIESLGGFLNGFSKNNNSFVFESTGDYLGSLFHNRFFKVE